MSRKTLIDGTDTLRQNGDPSVASGISSDFLNPIDAAQSWHVFFIGDTPSPGTIPVGGIKGFGRKTEWDIKKGKGASGATLTLVQRPPSKGSITIQLTTAQHFAELANFLPLLKYNSQKGTNADAVGIYHPALAFVDIHSVVVEEVGLPEHKGKGLYEITFDFIEWVPVPKAPIVSTPTKATETTTPTPGDLPDPIADEQQKQIQALLDEAGKP